MTSSVSEPNQPGQSIQSAQPATTGPNWKRRLILGGTAIVVLVLLILFARAYLPRWWAHRVGGQAKGHFSGGIWWGMFYGILFTFLPLIVARQAVRKRFKRPAKIITVVVAILLAAPNLLTLSVVLGSGGAAHAGQRIMDVEAPAFRGATLVGSIIGLAAGGFAIYALASRHRRGAELKRLRKRDREHDAAEKGREQPEKPGPTQL